MFSYTFCLLIHLGLICYDCRYVLSVNTLCPSIEFVPICFVPICFVSPDTFGLDMFLLSLRFVGTTLFQLASFACDMFCPNMFFPYTLSLPVRFIADIFCPPLRFVPICFVHCFVGRYVVGPIRFVSIKFCCR
jgi:hypothetical protein